MAPNSPKTERALELAARKDIDLIGLGQVLPEQVPRTILVGRWGPGRGCLGRLRAAPLLRSSATGAIVSARPAPTRCARSRTRGAACARVRKRFGATWSPAGEYQLRTLLFGSAVDTRFVAGVGWCAFFRTET